MDKVSVFESSDFGELRIIVDPKGDVWFVASDVAKSLGYINAKDAVKRHVDDDDSMLLQVSDNQWGVKRSILKTRYIDSIRIINESGLYSLILSSKLESAKRFKKWVTSEVLPSIRKTGEYKTSSGGKGILVPDFSNPADAARAWADQYEAAQKAIAEKSQAEAEKQQVLKTIEEHKPDVEFAESFRKVDHNNMWLIRDIAKKLEQNGVIIAEKNLRSFLEEAKSMFRNGLGKWELYSNVVAKGYGVYRSYFVDKYSGERVNQQTIYMFSNALADEAVKKMVNVDGSKRIWKQPEIKDIFEKCGAKKPDKATWGDVQYVFAMYYSDGFPKVFKCENELVKATLMYLDDPDAPEGVAFIRWLAVQDYLGEKINWKDLT